MGHHVGSQPPGSVQQQQPAVAVRIRKYGPTDAKADIPSETDGDGVRPLHEDEVWGRPQGFDGAFAAAFAGVYEDDSLRRLGGWCR